MTGSTRRKAGLHDLATALIERLEVAEYLAIRSLPKASRATRLHTSRLRQAAEDAATLAAAIDILVSERPEITPRRR